MRKIRAEVSRPLSPFSFEKGFREELYYITNKCFNEILKVSRKFNPITLGRTEEKLNSPKKWYNSVDDILIKWNRYIDKINPILVKKLQKKIKRYVDKKYNVYGLNFSVDSVGLRQEMDAHAIATMQLIKSIPSDIVERITPIVMNSLQNGDRDKVFKEIKKAQQVSLKRAKFIARDQVAKNLEAINTGRARQLNLEYYIWDTMEDERVSKGYGGHRQLNGKIFKWDEPEAVINSNGDKGHPKERPNCRCRRRWIFLKPGQEMKKIELGYKIVDTTTKEKIYLPKDIEK